MGKETPFALRIISTRQLFRRKLILLNAKLNAMPIHYGSSYLVHCYRITFIAIFPLPVQIKLL